MTKLIAALIIIAFLWGAWELFLYWDKVKNEEETAQKQAAASVVRGETLPGMPYQLDASLAAAQSQGVTGMSNWLRTYSRTVQDPRKAWIELDYCLMLSKNNVPEARRLFAEVKARTPQSSPVWPRIKQLEKTYQ